LLQKARIGVYETHEQINTQAIDLKGVAEKDGSTKVRFPSPAPFYFAGVAKWHTQQTQNLPSLRT
jgi:hypothetical protein